MIVMIMLSTMPVISGKTTTKLSLLNTMSPGNLNGVNFGKNRKTAPNIINSNPRMIRNRAALCTQSFRLFLGLTAFSWWRFRLGIRFFQIGGLFFPFLRQMRAFVVGHIESIALEYQTSAAADQSSDPSTTFGAVSQRLISNLLEFLKCVFTIQALIFVGRHMLNEESQGQEARMPAPLTPTS